MTNVIGEATRELDEYKNNVDEERTHLNYNLIEGSETRADIIAKINTRVKDVMGDKIKPQTRKKHETVGNVGRHVTAGVEWIERRRKA